MINSVGPVPLGVVWVLLGWLVAIAVARWRRPPPQPDVPRAGSLLLDMLLLGLLGGRIGFVIAHWRDYLEAPWSMLRLSDGGFLVWPALLVGLGWGFWRLRRWPTLQRPVWAGALAGVLCWAVLSLGSAHLQQSRVSLPELTLQDLAGQPVVLAELAGQPVVINLWASWCGPCRREMPMFAAAQQREAGVRFLFVNQGEGIEDVQRFLAHEGLTLNDVLLDEDSATSAQLQVHAYPTTLFFDREGRLQGLHLGELSRAGLQSQLDRLR